MENDSFKIIQCPECKSEIAIDNRTIYPIDCDCGAEISESKAMGCVQKDGESK